MVEDVHQDCHHPVEISDVITQRKRRWAITMAIVGSLLAVVVALVTVSSNAGALASDLRHIDANEAQDREDLRQLRRDLVEVERDAALKHQSLLEAIARVETRLQTMAEAQRSISGRKRR